METKITLRLDENIVHAARDYAQRQGVSLSKLVADYLQVISAKAHPSKSRTAFEPTPILAEITGVLRNTSRRKDAGTDCHDYLEEKYL